MYSRLPYNPYFSVDGPGYGLSEILELWTRKIPMMVEKRERRTMGAFINTHLAPNLYIHILTYGKALSNESKWRL